MGLEPGTRVTDRVTLVRRLGEGSMGEVWVGRHATLGAEVAVKFISEQVMSLHEDAYERFSREAAAAARIKSPHVVSIFDHGALDDGTPFIVMELLEGSTLQQRLDALGPLSLGDVATVLRHVGGALDAAHDEGIVHRDVKPQNIFLVEQSSGEVFAKVVDFGSAKLAEASGQGARLTLPGMVVGTPEYISPDIIQTPGSLDHYADLWALGVVTYKCLTGRLPFVGDGIGETGAAILEGRFAKPSRVAEVDPRFDGWFAKVFSHDRKNRPSSGAAMAKSFDKVVRAVRRTGEHRSPSATGQERPWILVAAAATAIAAAAVVVAARRGGAPEASPAAPSPSASSSEVSATAPAPTGAPVVEGTAVALVASGAPTASASEAAPSDAGPSEDGPTVDRHPDPPIPEERASESFRKALADERVTVPAGPFWMGCSEADPSCAEHEKPGRLVELDAFAIDRREVTVALYTRCVQAGVCAADEVGGFRLEGGPFTRSSKCNWGDRDKQNHPINCVTYEEAHRFCHWVGARLPTEAEWEKAARGKDQRIFPWAGEHAVCAVAVMNEGTSGCRAHGTWPAGSKTAGASPYGVLNLAGNVREWVADRYDPDYFSRAPEKDPPGPAAGTMRVGKGGNWANGVARFLRISTREGFRPDTRAIHMGFRCAADVE